MLFLGVMEVVMFKRIMFGINRIRYNWDTKHLVKDLSTKAIMQINEPQTNKHKTLTLYRKNL